MAHGAVRILLRLEGLVAFGLSVWLYADHGRGWLAFALLFLTPDLSLAGYLVGLRGGSTIYNVVHSYTLPLVLGTPRCPHR